jgi:RNA polymerase sigma factor (TIGR02999 family)
VCQIEPQLRFGRPNVRFSPCEWTFFAAKKRTFRRKTGYHLYMTTDVSRILSQLNAGDPVAAKALFPLVYDELRRMAASQMANERPGQTLQTTALVNEAYLRLAGKDGGAEFANRRHFFAAAAQAMRRILVDQARRKKSQKQGGDRARVEFDDAVAIAPAAREDLVALDQALTKLKDLDPSAAELVELRYFTGLTLPQIADMQQVSERTLQRNWSFARAWLHREISGAGCENDDVK